jgi:hypothetical protein
MTVIYLAVMAVGMTAAAVAVTSVAGIFMCLYTIRAALTLILSLRLRARAL